MFLAELYAGGAPLRRPGLAGAAAAVIVMAAAFHFRQTAAARSRPALVPGIGLLIAVLTLAPERA